MDLHLDLDATPGRRVALERTLRTAIQTGRLRAGAALPSTRSLARGLGIARGTVSAAYDQLVAEGYLVARRGSGTAVADVPRPTAATPVVPTAPAPPRHDLRPGRPDPTTFPAAAWLRATRRVLAGSPPDVHQLGDPRGRVELRAALAAYLGRVRGVLTAPDRIVVTCGFTQAFGLLVQVLHDRGTTAIGMEDPGHPYHREIARRGGLRVLAVPVDEQGARTDGVGAPVVVLTPAHQYPTGPALAPARRQALGRWAAGGGLVVEDDYDGEFRYDREPLGALQGTAPEGVVYIGSASKTLAPALRLGWMVLPEPLVDAVAEAKRYADAQTSSLTQLVLADLIDTHVYDRHIRTARLRYRRRRDDLRARLRDTAPQVRIDGGAAGLQALLRLPRDGPAEATVLARAEERGVALQPLGVHWHAEGRHPQGLVVGFATPPQHAWHAAVEALCTVLSGR